MNACRVVYVVDEPRASASLRQRCRTTPSAARNGSWSSGCRTGRSGTTFFRSRGGALAGTLATAGRQMQRRFAATRWRRAAAVAGVVA